MDYLWFAPRSLSAVNIIFVYSLLPTPSERGHRANYLHDDNEAIATSIEGSQTSLCRGLQRPAGWGPESRAEGTVSVREVGVTALGNKGSWSAPDSTLGNPPLCPEPKNREDLSHL